MTNTLEARRPLPSRKRGSREPPRTFDAAVACRPAERGEGGARSAPDDGLGRPLRASSVGPTRHPASAERGERSPAAVDAEASYPRGKEGARKTLVIACGALAREVLALKLDWIDLACLPASLHNRSDRIPEAMRAKIRANRSAYDEILCLYGDCGTGGALDRVLAEEGVKRIAGAHCYAFYAGEDAFAALAEEEPGTFYLTDFLARHFEALVIKGLGLDRFPQLRDDYFGAYRRVVHLAQVDDPETEAKAKAAAERLGLAYERRFTGLDGLARFLNEAARDETAEDATGRKA
jgi:hypothetical protein